MKSAELPNDINALKKLIQERDQKIAVAESKIHELTSKLSWAEEKYLALERRYFGRKSERYNPEDDKQNRLFDEAEAFQDPAAPPVVEKITVPAHDRAKRGRKPKDDKLPVREVIHKLPPEERACPACGEERPVIGEERSSEYHLVPAHVEKIVHVRKVYGPCSCDGFEASGVVTVLTAPGAAKIVPGSDFSNGSIAFFITGKYADAVPFYRMATMLDRSGLSVSRQTLSNLAIGTARAIGDLTEAMNRDVLTSPVILMDETTVQVLKHGEGPPGKSYMWAMRGFSGDKPIVRFAWNASRSGSFADTLLKGYRGFLQTDGYAGYDHLDGRDGIVHVGCFAHIRRKFVEAWETAGKTGRAKEAVDTIAKLYAVESTLRERMKAGKLAAAEFVGTREYRVLPIIAEFRSWLDARLLDTAPQSALGKATSYAAKILPRAERYLGHELMTPDTNAIENAIRPFVIGRKNWLFSGSQLGAHSSAALYSLIETAKANGHEPFAYLTYLFDALPRCSSLDEKLALLPYRLSPSSYAAADGV